MLTQVDVRRKARLALILRARSNPRPGRQVISDEGARFYRPLTIGMDIPPGWRRLTEKQLQAVEALPEAQQERYDGVRKAGGTHAEAMAIAQGRAPRKSVAKSPSPARTAVATRNAIVKAATASGRVDFGALAEGIDFRPGRIRQSVDHEYAQELLGKGDSLDRIAQRFKGLASADRHRAHPQLTSSGTGAELRQRAAAFDEFAMRIRAADRALSRPAPAKAAKAAPAKIATAAEPSTPPEPEYTPTPIEAAKRGDLVMTSDGPRRVSSVLAADAAGRVSLSLRRLDDDGSSPQLAGVLAAEPGRTVQIAKAATPAKATPARSPALDRLKDAPEPVRELAQRPMADVRKVARYFAVDTDHMSVSRDPAALAESIYESRLRAWRDPDRSPQWSAEHAAEEMRRVLVDVDAAKPAKKATPAKAAPSAVADLRADDIITLRNGVRGRVVSRLPMADGGFMVTYRDLDRDKSVTVSMEADAPIAVDRPTPSSSARKATSPTPKKASPQSAVELDKVAAKTKAAKPTTVGMPPQGRAATPASDPAGWAVADRWIEAAEADERESNLRAGWDTLEQAAATRERLSRERAAATSEAKRREAEQALRDFERNQVQLRRQAEHAAEEAQRHRERAERMRRIRDRLRALGWIPIATSGSNGGTVSFRSPDGRRTVGVPFGGNISEKAAADLLRIIEAPPTRKDTRQPSIPGLRTPRPPRAPAEPTLTSNADFEPWSPGSLVTHEGRQYYVWSLGPNGTVWLVPEVREPGDPGAISVYPPSALPLGQRRRGMRRARVFELALERHIARSGVIRSGAAYDAAIWAAIRHVNRTYGAAA